VAFAGGTNPLAATATAAEADARVTPDLGQPVVGGPLYPPVHALYYYPLGLVRDSQLAYRLFQLFSVLSVFGSGLAVRFLSRGRVWWPVATTVLFLMPGMRPGFDLGQNHAITLLIVLTGWAVAARASQFGGGMVWGYSRSSRYGAGVHPRPDPDAEVEVRRRHRGGGNWHLPGHPPVRRHRGVEELAPGGAECGRLVQRGRELDQPEPGRVGHPKRVYLDFSKPKKDVADEGVNRMGTSCC